MAYNKSSRHRNKNNFFGVSNEIKYLSLPLVQFKTKVNPKFGRTNQREVDTSVSNMKTIQLTNRDQI